MLAGCAPTVEEQVTLERLIWPEPPAQPRLEFLTSFTGPEDFGIKKSFLQWVGLFISGKRWQHLITPMAVTVTPGGTVYVADPGANGIHRFDKKNEDYRLIFRKEGLALPSPVGLASDPSGAVYVMDSRLGALFVIEPDATEAVLVPLQGLLDRPTGLALDPVLGNFYIVDTGSHQVKVFARDGTLLKRIGHRGSGPGEFNYPTMIWRDQQGQVFVSDSMNFRIQIFDPEGQFLREFGKIGNVSGTHSQPKGIASDQYGHIYIVATLFHTIQLFDPYGTFLLNVGRQGQNLGEFFMPTGIFIGERNTIYVADEYNRRVQVFRYIGPPPL
jgi:DNA-binding beta-propeller fold protein YncE